MTIDIALALLALAAPVTAAILKFAPERKNGYVTKMEYDVQVTSLKGWIHSIERRMDAHIEKYRSL